MNLLQWIFGFPFFNKVGLQDNICVRFLIINITNTTNTNNKSKHEVLISTKQKQPTTEILNCHSPNQGWLIIIALDWLTVWYELLAGNTKERFEQFLISWLNISFYIISSLSMVFSTNWHSPKQNSLFDKHFCCCLLV